MKKITLFLPIIFIIFLALIGINSVNNSKNIQDSALKIQNSLVLGKAIDLPKFKFKNLYNEDEIIDDKDLKNKKEGYILINLFASWCLSCHKEHKNLIDLAKEKKLMIYGIAVRDINKNTKIYLQNYQNPYIKVLIDKKGKSLKLFSAEALPESFLVNDVGQIIFHHQGPINDKVKEYIKKIINNKFSNEL